MRHDDPADDTEPWGPGRCPNCGEDDVDGGRCYYCGWPEHSENCLCADCRAKTYGKTPW